VKAVPTPPTLSAPPPAVGAIAQLRAGKMSVRSLQEYQQEAHDHA
jgi:hypothetical protein